MTEERGAALALTAVSLTAVIGMAAFAVDAGALYSERRELQNGADAAVLAIAEDCADEDLPCTYASALASAETYADANASDTASLVDSIVLDPVEKSVTVTLRSEDEAGETVMAPFFAQLIGFDGTEVAATATAEWGFLEAHLSAPLILSDCEWLLEYQGGDQGPHTIKTGAPPQSPAPYGKTPVTFFFHEGGSEEPCHDSGSGFDLPGGFGWLDATDCTAWAEVGVISNSDPGASPSNGCTASLLKEILMDDAVPALLPYFGAACGAGGALGGTGNNIWYCVSGLGPFAVTGYNFAGQYKESRMGYPVPCSGSQRCIAGFFTTHPFYDGELGGSDRGAILIKLTH